MVLEELRELERRWGESGHDSDHAAWIGAAVRLGVLDREIVRFAAELGHPAACTATGGAPSPTFDAIDWYERVRDDFTRREDSLLSLDPSASERCERARSVLLLGVARALAGLTGSSAELGAALDELIAGVRARSEARVESGRERARTVLARESSPVARLVELWELGDTTRSIDEPERSQLRRSCARLDPEAVRGALDERIGGFLLVPAPFGPPHDLPREQSEAAIRERALDALAREARRFEAWSLGVPEDTVHLESVRAMSLACSFERALAEEDDLSDLAAAVVVGIRPKDPLDDALASAQSWLRDPTSKRAYALVSAVEAVPGERPLLRALAFACASPLADALHHLERFLERVRECDVDTIAAVVQALRVVNVRLEA